MKAVVNNADASIASSGLATEAKQDSQITELQSIKAAVEIIDNAIAGSEMQVDVVSSTLPTGAATEATLASIDGKDFATQTTLASLDSKDFATQTTLAALLTELQGKADLAETQPISAASLPLPSGASTLAEQQTQTTHLSTLAGAVSGVEMQVDVVSSALPSGAATETTLAAIKTAVEIIDNIVSGSEAQVDVITLPAIPAGTNLIGYQAPAAVAGSSNAKSKVKSTALEASHVIKASAGRLYSLTITNTKTSAQYIQLFDSTTVPADATVPDYCVIVPASSSISLDDGDIGSYFSTGIAVSNSSTVATKTIGSADCLFYAEYL